MRRSVIGVVVSFLVLLVIVFWRAHASAFVRTDNVIPKYNGTAFVNSTVTEVDGRVEIGGTATTYVPVLNIAASTHGSPTSARAAISFGANAALSTGWFLGQGRAADDTHDFYLFDANTSRDVLYASTGGNVGVGTTSPAYKLDVNGDISATGTILAKYQDVAEWVDAMQAIPVGSVVVIRNGNVVDESRKPYDTSVVGVVSEHPGVALGEKRAGRVLVAHSGRVRVKVDASYGAVIAGDLLVTSRTPGYAMRSQPLTTGGDVPFHRPGTVVGKALQSLHSGKGEILVLVTLQ